jgi:hypothetical protein
MPFLSFPSSSLGTHLDAKLQLGNRNVTYGLPAIKQSRSFVSNGVPKRELGNQKRIKLWTIIQKIMLSIVLIEIIIEKCN